MAAFPDRPFLTEPYDTDGGGLDHLGLGQVNLALLQAELIPGLNNVTGDFGVFCLGAWIPWKFAQLAGGQTSYTSARYRAFREAIEVAMSYATRHDSPVDASLGGPWRKMGVMRQPALPCKPTFAATARTGATSLYAAALYGPALRYLGLLRPADARALDGTSSGIPVTSDDADTLAIVHGVESAVSRSGHFGAFVRLQPPAVGGAALDDLGTRGLHPAHYRAAPPAVKRAFLRKFFWRDEPGERRRRTAALILDTARQTPVNEPEALRRCWYTGLRPDGRPLALETDVLRGHRSAWAVFQARQLQRTILELLLRCFELALGAGCRTIPDALAHWRERSPTRLGGLLSGTVEEHVRAEAAAVTGRGDLAALSQGWNAAVHGAHPAFDDVRYSAAAADDGELDRAVRMLARWWLRTAPWPGGGVPPRWVEAGQVERLSVGWFHRWVRERLPLTVEALLREAFSELVFAQHVKVALMRFDGQIQRLRFTLGDAGIVPTTEVGDKLGAHHPRMADRLGSFLNILSDLDVVRRTDDTIAAGGLADAAFA